MVQLGFLSAAPRLAPAKPLVRGDTTGHRHLQSWEIRPGLEGVMRPEASEGDE